MKKLSVLIMAVILSVTFIPKSEAALSETTTESALTSKNSASVARLYEIKAMDKSNLSSVERKDLRKEVRSIRKDLGPGIYISAGALIIIIILLIILL